jgi:hypothetical protein
MKPQIDEYLPNSSEFEDLDAILSRHSSGWFSSRYTIELPTGGKVGHSAYNIGNLSIDQLYKMILGMLFWYYPNEDYRKEFVRCARISLEYVGDYSKLYDFKQAKAHIIMFLHLVGRKETECESLLNSMIVHLCLDYGSKQVFSKDNIEKRHIGDIYDDFISWARKELPSVSSTVAAIHKRSQKKRQNRKERDDMKYFLLTFCGFSAEEISETSRIITATNFNSQFTLSEFIDRIMNSECVPPYLVEHVRNIYLNGTIVDGECSDCWLQERGHKKCGRHLKLEIEDLPPIEPPVDAELTVPSSVPPPEQPQKTPEKYQCAICMDRGITTVFFPCGHAVCSECKVDKCHICRGVIVQKIIIRLV